MQFAIRSGGVVQRWHSCPLNCSKQIEYAIINKRLKPETILAACILESRSFYACKRFNPFTSPTTYVILGDGGDLQYSLHRPTCVDTFKLDLSIKP